MKSKLMSELLKKIDSLPFDSTRAKVDKNFELNNFVVSNVPTPTVANHIAKKGYVETWIKKDGPGNIDAESKKNHERNRTNKW